MVKCFVESGPFLRKRVKVFEHLASMRNPEYLRKKEKEFIIKLCLECISTTSFILMFYTLIQS